MLICSSFRSLAVKTIRANTGAVGVSKYDHKICDTHCLLPRCRRRARCRLLIKTCLHYAARDGNPGAGSARTLLPSRHVGCLRRGTKRFNKNAGTQAPAAVQLGEISQIYLRGRRPRRRIIQYQKEIVQESSQEMGNLFSQNMGNK